MTHEEEIATIMAIGERRIAGIDKADELLDKAGITYHNLTSAFIMSTDEDFPALLNFLKSVRSCVNVLENLTEMDYKKQSIDEMEATMSKSEEFLTWFEDKIKGTAEIVANANKEAGGTPVNKAIHSFMEASKHLH